MTQTILTEVAPGELIDKITILEIKSEKFETGSEKHKNVTIELDILQKTQKENIKDTSEIRDLKNQLKQVNSTLWKIEDDIRDCERDSDFSDTFVQLARAVYHENDKRAALKKDINVLLGSNIIEEKSYAAY